MEIKDILKNKRESLGMTCEDVGRKVGVSASTISRWERGDIANMKRDKIAKLSEVLRISPSVIMGWDEPEEPSYYHDPEVARYVDMLHKSEGQRILLDASKDLNMEDLKFLATMAEKMRGNNNDDTGC